MIFASCASIAKITTKKIILIILGDVTTSIHEHEFGFFNLFPKIAHGNIDVFGFAGTSIVLGWVLYMDKLLELQPIAAQHFTEGLPDALLVPNASQDFN